MLNHFDQDQTVEIRPAGDGDIPSIVDLLRSSLGESLMPKSERYWRWKHIDNPFGRSPVLLAHEDTKLVGVRAFMRWTWSGADGRILAVRAVDTATHPDFQGKGIFSKLTMALLDRCANDGLDIVFNTPNEKSKPGYIKMGWVEAGKLPVHLRVLRPLSMASALIMKHEASTSFKTSDTETHYLLHHPALNALLAANFRSTPAFQTAHSPQSLSWRYSDVPVAEYRAGGIANGNEIRALYIYRLKSSRYGLEFRIADTFAQDAASRKELAPLIVKRALSERAHYITQDALGTPAVPGLLTVKTNAGSPTVTVRNISSSMKAGFIGFKNWAPSLGDLELF